MGVRGAGVCMGRGRGGSGGNGLRESECYVSDILLMEKQREKGLSRRQPLLQPVRSALVRFDRIGDLSHHLGRTNQTWLLPSAA